MKRINQAQRASRLPHFNPVLRIFSFIGKKRKKKKKNTVEQDINMVVRDMYMTKTVFNSDKIP